ncbi:MAG: lysophospholipase [Gammaproteobacteria bacterium]|nr:lysophospholipase [Gammaproteobacteria bacterium]MBU1491161.1 lysophospholipase [Gammaproteobacteria bacterium]MBU2065926.1 lysophospholipase [Gammaproteobacteria bacterium]MBU2141252.1 lysophospholipase [Gammaproteobacteria bacterium]MBU2215840.1 lysophospholipase [Gammaproteobacteria bacterium]
MLRALLLTLSLLTGLAQASTTFDQRPQTLETERGILRGTLLQPRTTQPMPVVLLIAGSGPTDRDGNNPAGHNDSLKRLAMALAREGIASLRYDKRGVAASRAATPNERDLSVEQYVADAAAWGRQLKADPAFDRLILLGHSEGALIASLAADASQADAVVSLAGSSRPIDQVLREQLQYRLPPQLLAQSTQLLDALLAGQTVSEVPDELQVLFRPSVQPYLISLFRQDPSAAFASLRMPALIVQGTHDIQVGVADAQALQTAKPDAQLALIDGMNHVLRIVPMDLKAQLASYDEPGLPLANALSQALVTFIKQTDR